MALTHSQHLERWLGKEMVEHISSRMTGWYGPPINISNVPGRNIMAHGDGGFSGKINGGMFAGLADYAIDIFRKIKRGIRRTHNSNVPSNGIFQLNAGFSSFSDFLSEATAGGKRQSFIFAKTGVTGVANCANSLWDVGAFPHPGSISAAPAGSSPDNTTTGGFLQENPTGGDTLHFVSSTAVATVSASVLLLHDRFFQVNHDLANDPQTVTGVPTRYQSTAEATGNFITAFVTTALGAGTPTYEITYMDEAGNTAEASATQTIVGSAIARRYPFASSVGNGWWFPLNSPDTGVRKITNLNLSAASTGNIDIVLCDPFSWIPCPVANIPVILDGINSNFSFAKIPDNSCLSLMEINKNATTATNFSGIITLVAG